MTKHHRAPCLCALLGLSIATLAPAQVPINVLTANYNNARTNANLNETVLNTLNVNPSQFGKLFSLPVTGFINGQPLYVANVGIPGKGTHNVVYVVTMHNDVYAFDADTQGASLWHLNLGPPVPVSDAPVSDLTEIGILGTPVIDAGTNTIYLVAYTKENGDILYRLHALDISTGQEKFGGPVVIQATVPGNGLASANGQIQFDASQHLQRPGLLLLNNIIYIGFGSHSDIGKFHGWFMGYNAQTLEQLSVMITSPNGWGASIWQGGRGPAADDQGNIYWSTGNGTYDGKANWGESFVKLTTSSGVPTVVDWFTPDNWSNMNDLDNDLGSCGPVLTSLGTLVGGGKEGILYVIDRSHMGHTQPGNGQILQHFQAIGFAIYNMAFWDRRGGPIVYLRAFNDALKAFTIANNRFQTTPSSQAGFVAGLPFDGMAVSANGSAAYSGILWQTVTKNGNQNGAGTLHAFSATNLGQELWNSDINAARDGLGTLAKFTAPTVANGKVYVATFSNSLMVYGLLSQKPVIGQVVNSASSLGGPLAPGELISIYGSDLGPSQLAGAQLDSSGHLVKNLGGTQVLFNNAAAPLIYARADQVGAIVPIAVAGQSSVTIKVQYHNQSTPVFQAPVTATAPGVFTLDQSGHGPGAILNQDGSINGSSNPAARGSIVVLWGTGEGLSKPDLPEDELPASPLPEPLNPVTVMIGRQKADLLYAGAAPGLAGVIQINARVPSGITPGNVPVVVTIGSASSQAGVTLAVK
jgi:uncharacterized protein (TIGR03437 family)